MKSIILIIILAGFALFPFAVAEGLNCHVKGIDDAIAKAPDGPIKSLVQANYYATLKGVVFTDFPVPNYYAGYPFSKDYADTHTKSLSAELHRRAVTDAEKALAYGVDFHQSAQDAIIHNYWIPLKIQQGFYGIPIPNWVIHPLSEAIAETSCLNPKITRIMLGYDDPQPGAPPSTRHPTGRSLFDFYTESVKKDYSKEAILMSNALATSPDKLWGGLSTPVDSSSPIYGLYQSLSDGNVLLGVLLILAALIQIVAVWRGSLPYHLGEIPFILLGIILSYWGYTIIAGNALSLGLFVLVVGLATLGTGIIGIIKGEIIGPLKPGMLLLSLVMLILGIGITFGIKNVTNVSDFWPYYDQTVDAGVKILQGVDPNDLNPTGGEAILAVDIIPATGAFIVFMAFIGWVVLSFILYMRGNK